MEMKFSYKKMKKISPFLLGPGQERKEEEEMKIKNANGKFLKLFEKKSLLLTFQGDVYGI